jgi:omega-amidase
MNDTLKIGLVQANPSFSSIEGNLAALEEQLDRDNSGAEIYLLPELFNTGYRAAFTTRPETMGLLTTRWMRQMAQRKNAAVCGSIAISENGKVFNRMLFVGPDGTVQHYDKVNVFAFSGEDKVFSPGQTGVIFSYLGWSIKATICFDMRFPETIRNHAPYYDLILCSAHWPEPRIQAWDKILPARAIENQAFLAAVNRIGEEGEARYPGHSCLLDFMGSYLWDPMLAEEILTVEISKTAQNKFRQSFPFLKP